MLEFSVKYPDEVSCIARLRELHEKEGHVCPRCGYKEWCWKGDKLCYECKKCHHHESLRKGIVMEKSKFLFRYRFVTMHLLTAMKNSFSAWSYSVNSAACFMQQRIMPLISNTEYTFTAYEP